jgi:hypothetical protein
MRRDAETILAIRGPRGPRGLPGTEAYRLLDRRDLSRRAYGQLDRHQGAMTPGSPSETVDGMSREQSDAIMDAVRHAR